jgi:hypothetical protein
MRSKTSYLFRSVVIGVPVVVLVLWVSSGREVLTKAEKAQAVQVADPLFGGTDTEQHFVRGPVAGYYVGLDLVAVTACASLGACAVAWWIKRRKARGKERNQYGAAKIP